MTDTKLYKVVLTMETLVAAENAERARVVTMENFGSAQLTGEVLETRCTECKTLADLPAGWGKFDTPFGDCSPSARVVDFFSRKLRVVIDVQVTSNLTPMELENALANEMCNLTSHIPGVAREDLVSVTEVVNA